MMLRVEVPRPDIGLAESLAQSLLHVTKLRGSVEQVSPGTLPNDGKVIDDTRPVG
jgi:phenylacetate-CoA ligase